MIGQQEQDGEVHYSHIVFQLRLPYRLFLDDGRYSVRYRDVVWGVYHRTLPQISFDFTRPIIDFGDRAQLYLDNHGYSGHSEMLVSKPFDQPRTRDSVMHLQTSEDGIGLGDALGPPNRLISLYRAKTGEFWFRPLGPLDFPAYSTFLKPTDSDQLDSLLVSTNTRIASGYPYLKREAWYRDLLWRAEIGIDPPFALELIHEGRDALERNNLRLAATNFALSVEALFRSLLLEYFPEEDVTRSADQMIGTYYRRFREIGEPQSLPLRKKDAVKHFNIVWKSRDRLMHGHELDLTLKEVQNAEKASLNLFDLWIHRPHAVPFSIEGPFADWRPDTRPMSNFPPRDAQELFERSVNRYHGGHLRDAEEAARFALVAEPNHIDATVVLGIVACELEDYAAAVEWFERALQIDPDFVPARENLKYAREKL